MHAQLKKSKRLKIEEIQNHFWKSHCEFIDWTPNPQGRENSVRCIPFLQMKLGASARFQRCKHSKSACADTNSSMVFCFCCFCLWVCAVLCMGINSYYDAVSVTKRFQVFFQLIHSIYLYPVPNAYKTSASYCAFVHFCASVYGCRLLNAAAVSAGNCTPFALLFKFSLIQSTFSCLCITLANASTR